MWHGDDTRRRGDIARQADSSVCSKNEQGNFSSLHFAELRAGFASQNAGVRVSPLQANKRTTKKVVILFGGGGEIRTPAPGFPGLTI